MVKLMHTDGCHLCELAQALLDQAVNAGLISGYEHVDIALDDELVEKYGIRIPVVCDNNAELGWPFDYNGLQTFLVSHPN
ncbi:glutaredoxin family protein [Salinibius halmophilus]|uniref:glutaredoxin family protein n=1 Tax=Salinibius halmophilus TaxID=1853216 RepID=UPI000E662FB5|nr:glutaredoxin family protein [Salinibius halmophilus]